MANSIDGIILKVTIKAILVASIAFFIFSCGDGRIRKLDKIPNELQGEWVEDFAEFKLSINENRVVRTDLTVEYDEEQSIDTALEIYYRERASCEDCFEKGIEIVFKKDSRCLYFLDNYHPINKTYDKLKIVDVVFNPNTEKEEYFSKIWKRIN